MSAPYSSSKTAAAALFMQLQGTWWAFGCDQCPLYPCRCAGRSLYR